MDEFVDLSIAADLYRGLIPFKDIHYPRPFLFNYLFSLSFCFLNNSLWILWFNRFLFFLINIGILFFVYRITCYYLKEKIFAWFSVLLVSTAVPFLFNGCRIRSDVINSFLYLIVYYDLLIHWKKPKFGFIEGGILGVSFLISQKAVYYVLVYFLSIFLLAYVEKRKDLWERLKRGALGFLCVLAIYLSLILTIGASSDFFKTNIQRAFYVGIISNTYNSFKYLGLFASRNIVSVLLFLFSFLLQLKFSLYHRFQKGTSELQKTPNNILLIHVVVLFGILFLHKAKFPYFFVMSIPLLAVFISFQMQTFLSKSKLLFISIVIAVSLIPLFLSLFLWKKTASYQFELIKAAEKCLDPGDSYFDGIGMVFLRPKASQLNLTRRNISEYYHGKYPRLIQELKNKQCKLIISNYRIKKLKEPENSFINNNYIQIPKAPHILIPGKILPRDKSNFEINIEGNYILLKSSDVKIKIDGREVNDKIYLSRGMHYFSLEEYKEPIVLAYESFGRIKKDIKYFRDSVYLLYNL